MIVFRIAVEKYAKKLSASGYANRWNKETEYVIYTASSRSLATLELVVHRASIKPSLSYKIMVVEINITKAQIEKIELENLPGNWRSIAAYSKLQEIGSQWYAKKTKLLLEIPSAVIPKERNYIINMQHKFFESKVKLIATEDYFWDDRLL